MPTGNAGRESMRGLADAEALREKYYDLVHEVHHLKKERNDQEKKFTDLNTKFKRLSRDLKIGGSVHAAAGVDDGDRMKLEKQNAALRMQLDAAVRSKDEAEAKLREAWKIIREHSARGPPQDTRPREEITHWNQMSAQSYLDAQERKARQSASGGRTPTATPRTQSPNRAVAKYNCGVQVYPMQRTVATMTAENGESFIPRDVQQPIFFLSPETHTAYTAAPMPSDGGAGGGSVPFSAVKALQDQLSQMRRDNERLREKTQEDAIRIDMLQRDAELQAAARSATANVPQMPASQADGSYELRRDMHEKTAQLSVLNNRITLSQTQVNTLKNESQKLVEELKEINTTATQQRQKIFQLEQEKASLELKADRHGELELQLRQKSEEVIRVEGELMRLVERVQACTRDAEMQTRKECAERYAALEQMLDDANNQRRTKERELFALQQDAHDMKRQLNSANANSDEVKKDLARLQKENTEMKDRLALLGADPSMRSGFGEDDEVHKALALVELKRKTTSTSVGDLWQDLNWNSDWELAQLREAVAKASLELEMAEQRCDHMNTANASQTKLLKEIVAERDTLLDENMAMRQKLTGVGCRMIGPGPGDAEPTENDVAITVNVSVERMTMLQTIPACPDGGTYSPSMFIALEGLSGFNTACSETFYDVTDVVSSPEFVFPDIALDETLREDVVKGKFTFHLHQTNGFVSDVVAAGSIPISTLCAIHPRVAHRTNLVLCDTRGTPLMRLSLCITVTTPVPRRWIDYPVAEMKASEVQSVMMKLRCITALRVQVFSCTGLTAGPPPPDTYVFFSASKMANGAPSFIADSTVHRRAGSDAQNPQFDHEDRTMTDFAIVMDRDVVQYCYSASIVFAVLNHSTDDPRDNLGVASVPLCDMLKQSPLEPKLYKEALSPQGTLEFGLSWVTMQ